MGEANITLATDPSDEETEIFSVLRSYNVSRVGESHVQSLHVFLRDASGKVVGGLRGSTYWEWLHVSLLVIEEAWRGKGWGSRMLAQAEREALRRGCRGVYLDTFSFQALPFYQKQGYEVFGTLEDHPPGHACYFLKKRLLTASEE